MPMHEKPIAVNVGGFCVPGLDVTEVASLTATLMLLMMLQGCTSLVTMRRVCRLRTGGCFHD
jgi:hypothetical protein